MAASDPDTQSYVIIMVTQQVLKNISYGYNATAAAGCLAGWLECCSWLRRRRGGGGAGEEKEGLAIGIIIIIKRLFDDNN